ncbi:Pyruvate carboxylase [Cupriavidus taiwanensis]|uniref:pyruvate carboxylase n=1 Tax=Cupriavidus taiwanensis TaxID=164546 RepID=UPI000E19A9E2|nr:pyruvate carboxylase [Cupriavidus taiwanensis]SOY93306.1 Pyruvate carboxylase [Cupriavidus taiwanensis]SOY96448.1 Pyruvate carboxylase [Cupriavidus taiwanensis]
MKQIKSILVANRGEIAIRIMRAASELGIRTIAIYSNEDRFALHRFKADESYLVGKGMKPTQAYLAIPEILRIATEVGVDAIHPGYGFLSENPDFAEACAKEGIEFIGPKPEVMRTLGNKVAARQAAQRANVPVMPATDALPGSLDTALAAAANIGYPFMLKASWGGGGRGMRVIETADDLRQQFEVARREAKTAFGNDEVYLEKLVRRARHVEVQVLGDTHGNLVHMFERDCSIQRRHQKVVERAPAPYLSEKTRESLCSAALRLASEVNYTHAGTVEFLLDVDTNEFYFIEVNPRIQVEHTVTEQVTGIDLIKAQIRVTEGARIGEDKSGVPAQSGIHVRGHALQCRVTTEDPENGFNPDYGRLSAYRTGAGFGIRLDSGTAYTGAVITPYYDSLLTKVTAWASTAEEAAHRMHRALREFRVRGVSTNLRFLENVVSHPKFVDGDYTTRFIDTEPELFTFAKRRDTATKLLQYIGEVTVHGSEEMRSRNVRSRMFPPPRVPATGSAIKPPLGMRDKLVELGPEAFTTWVLEQKPVMLTDTSMRDAHQSLFATRMRTRDMLEIAPHYATKLNGLFSVECWGGATFDVAMRFLKEDPWERLEKLRAAMPNLLLQMLLRASNAVGYTNYPDNVVRHFVHQAAASGIDVFRVFDSLNNVDNMRVAMEAVRETSSLCEAAVCYSGDLFDTSRQYTLPYYIKLAQQLQAAGAHMLAIKDMAGLCRPAAVRELVSALKQETGLPIHFHTHDTSGIAAASVLAAVEAGADVVDGAVDALSGLTSQPNLGSIVSALHGSDREPAIKPSDIQEISRYWEDVRAYYEPFESEIRSGTSEIYLHEMPGGQYTNLREQARALGLESRWAEVASAYAEVNRLFGDIVKVTPTSKVVGDMAIYMVANNLSAAMVLDKDVPIQFPDSVVSLFRGELGVPESGFPRDLQTKVLNGAQPLAGRPGASMTPVDFAATRESVKELLEREPSENDVAAYLMYPKVFSNFVQTCKTYEDVSVLPTPVFFYGMQGGEEVAIDIAAGKTLIVRLLGKSAVDEDGQVRLFFELNGQPRLVRVSAKPGEQKTLKRPLAREGNPLHIAAPMPGSVASLLVKVGDRVKAGQSLLSLEAMKMEVTIPAEVEGEVEAVHVKPGDLVDAKELLIALKPV